MDIEALLSPLDGPEPAGTDLSYTPEFDRIAEWRREDDPSLAQGAWIVDRKAADWPAVRRSCLVLLETRSKDLRLAAWLAEAAVHVDGHAGLADALAVCEGLCRRYWDELHPRPDGGDQEQRIGCLAWLLARLPALAQAVPVEAIGAPRYLLRELSAARQRRLAQAGRTEEDTGEPLQAETRAATERLLAVQKAVPAARWRGLDADAARAVAALETLRQVVDERLGDEGPSFGAAERALVEARAELARLWREVDPAGAQRPAARDDAPAADGSASRDAVAGADRIEAGSRAEAAAGVAAAAAAPEAPVPIARHAVPASASVAVRSASADRAEALARLGELAAYFRAIEPHSPVGYLVERAVRWGHMPLQDWLRAVVRDPGALGQVEELLGLGDEDGARR